MPKHISCWAFAFPHLLSVPSPQISPAFVLPPWFVLILFDRARDWARTRQALSVHR
ncbi:hypothetical protein LX36DRAFT_652263 [Colletotrichum falcatum]|nr:hypothetical protein LX36DRAFT_652263 [Colletotrichum falcatum]